MRHRYLAGERETTGTCASAVACVVRLTSHRIHPNWEGEKHRISISHQFLNPPPQYLPAARSHGEPHVQHVLQSPHPMRQTGRQPPAYPSSRRPQSLRSISHTRTPRSLSFAHLYTPQIDLPPAPASALDHDTNRAFRPSRSARKIP